MLPLQKSPLPLLPLLLLHFQFKRIHQGFKLDLTHVRLLRLGLVQEVLADLPPLDTNVIWFSVSIHETK
jgi:hypothetical protein